MEGRIMINENAYMELVKKNAGEIVEEYMEKRAFAPALMAGARALPKAFSKGAKSLGSLGKSQIELMKTQKKFAPLANKGLDGNSSAKSMIETSKANRDLMLSQAKPSLKNIGIGGAGIAAGATINSSNGNYANKLASFDFQSDTMNKEAASYLIDSLIQKQAAIETMAEAKIIAEASEKAMQSIGYSMFA